MSNLFLQAFGKKNTVTENGALSNSTTGNAFVDAFSTAPTYKGRAYSYVCSDQSLLWDINPELSVKFIFYLRMVTRKIKINNGFITETVQKGQGVKDEAFKRLLWVAENHPKTFNQNIWLLPLVGSWKDIWTLMYYDKTLNINAINHKAMFELLKSGLSLEEHRELIKKFMPRIKSNSKLKTSWTRTTNELAIEFANYMGWTLKEYNKLKTSGTAHDFQKYMCGQMYDKINWGHIPGRALTKIVNSKFIESHNLVESYMSWLETQDVANFTGYVFELGKVFRDNIRNLSLYKKHTLNKQFNALIEKAKADGKITENVWCALDTSSSMSWTQHTHTDVTPLDICMSLGIFFSTLNEGAFHKNVIMFDSTSRIRQLSGEFCDMMSQIPYNAMGGTNFQSVVDEIVRVRRANPNVPLEDYPKTLLIVSDMQFNPPTCRWGKQLTDADIETNYEAMKRKLYEVFPAEFVDEMKFIWWNVNSELKDFPSRIEDGGTYMLGGFDGSIISLLLGEDVKEKSEKKQINMEDLVKNALNQEILLQVKMVE